MTRTPKVYLVCYDIVGDNRRTRIYRTLRGYGDHMQYSVFRCLLSDLQFAELRQKLTGEIQADEDQILFVPIGSSESPQAQGMTTLGLPLIHPERVVRIFG